MSTTTLERLPEPHDAAAATTGSQNYHLPEVPPSRILQDVNEKDKPIPNAGNLLKTVDVDEHSLVQTETTSSISMPNGRSDLELSNSSSTRYDRDSLRGQRTVGQYYHEVPDLGVLTCAVCASPTVQVCKRCRSVAYCNREHQQKDWPRHNQDCHVRSELAIGVNSFLDPSRQAQKPIHRLTPGKLFEVQAILIPVDQPLPRIVKAAYEVVADEAEMRIKHQERCFDKLLGPAVPWVNDAQWDEDIRSEDNPFAVNISLPTSNLLGGVFSLHCRPNGATNKCYETLAGKQKTSSRTDTPVWGAIDPKDKHLHGNGSFLILKHPPRTSNARLPGSPVIDATLHDVKHVVSYLKQRHIYMNATGGAHMDVHFIQPPTVIPPSAFPAIPQPPPFIPSLVRSRSSRSSSPVRGRSRSRSVSPDARQPSPPRVPQADPISPTFSPPVKVGRRLSARVGALFTPGNVRTHA